MKPSGKHLRAKADNAGRTGLGRLVTGLGLALALTFASFGTVWFNLAGKTLLPAILALLAALQMAVHLRYFLDIGSGKNRVLTLVSGTFVLVLLLLMVGGTLWIMTDLDWRMMAAMPAR